MIHAVIQIILIGRDLTEESYTDELDWCNRLAAGSAVQKGYSDWAARLGSGTIAKVAAGPLRLLVGAATC